MEIGFERGRDERCGLWPRGMSVGRHARLTWIADGVDVARPQETCCAGGFVRWPTLRVR